MFNTIVGMLECADGNFFFWARTSSQNETLEKYPREHHVMSKDVIM